MLGALAALLIIMIMMVIRRQLKVELISAYLSLDRVHGAATRLAGGRRARIRKTVRAALNKLATEV